MKTTVQKVEHCVFSLAIMVWGSALLYFYLHEKLSVYINEKFHIYVLIGGLAALILGIFNLVTVNATADCGHDHDHGDDNDDCEHEHEHGSDLNPFVALLLITMPLVFAISSTTHGISDAHATSLSENDVNPQTFNFVDIPPFTLETLEKSRTKSADGAFLLNLLELFYSSGDKEQEKVIQGLYVETEAKLRNEPNRNDTGKWMRLYRLFMTCCAADTKAVPMSIEFEGDLPDISHHSWVRVAGEMHYELVDGVTYPIIKVKRIEQIPVPEGEWSEQLKK